MTRRPLSALDDFAGTGWGVACRWLGIRERGVELMAEAVATRDANGFETVGRDVWDHIAIRATIRALGGTPWLYDLYIGSPPCQTFSTAGNGTGRKALDEVIGLIDSRAYLDVDQLHEFGSRHDPRTALVLAPLVRIAADAPLFVVLEQVPPVLPVWERMADEMRRWGYSVWTGILHAEQYGVPQTRRRAVLIARADGIEAAPPTPTHSRYYPRNPGKLDEGVLPWVSMAEALPGLVGKVGFPRRADSSDVVTVDGVDYRARDMRESEYPAQAVTEKTRSWIVSTGAAGPGEVDKQGEPVSTWPERRPATTVPASDVVAGPGDFGRWEKGGVSRQARPGAIHVTTAEAAALQSYPAGFEFVGAKTKQFLQIGNAVPPLLARAILSVFDGA